VVLEQHPLDLDRAARPFEGARELYEEPVTDGLDLAPAVPREDRTEESPMHLEQLEREPLVALRERREADHVREHDRGQPPLPGLVSRHGPGPHGTPRAKGRTAGGYRATDSRAWGGGSLRRDLRGGRTRALAIAREQGRAIPGAARRDEPRPLPRPSRPHRRSARDSPRSTRPSPRASTLPIWSRRRRCWRSYSRETSIPCCGTSSWTCGATIRHSCARC